MKTVMRHVDRLNASRWQVSMAVTGGGTLAISDFLCQPGGSATILEAIVPYDQCALESFLGRTVRSACSGDTARAMAESALTRAKRLVRHSEHVAGIGCTASLVSSIAKRGQHRVHVACCTSQNSVVRSLILNKGRRSRAEEERVAADLVHQSLGALVGIEPEIKLLPGESIQY